MIRLLLFRFWPALLPLLIYVIWHRLAVRKAIREGTPAPSFRSGKLYWAVLASLGIAMLCFVYFGAQQEPHKGTYIPPDYKDGRLVPGHIE